MIKTYGERPIVFRFNDGALVGGNRGSNAPLSEEYMIGSEVGNYLRLFRGALYKKYPGLTRKTLSNEQRKRLVEMGHSQHVAASSITLLLASVFCVNTKTL